MRDIVYIAGHGKLASAILEHLPEIAQIVPTPIKSVLNWDTSSHKENDVSRRVVVHCGSGQQLDDVLEYCQSNRVPFIQCSTGVTIPDNFTGGMSFTIIDAPNLSIPIVRFLCVLEETGQLFSEYQISITESHQKAKTSIAGTAAEIAASLGVDRSEIKSIREAAIQKNLLNIPEEFISQHALHIIDIVGDKCAITLRTEVHGLETYVVGLARLINIIDRLPPGRHALKDLVLQHIV